MNFWQCPTCGAIGSSPPTTGGCGVCAMNALGGYYGTGAPPPPVVALKVGDLIRDAKCKRCEATGHVRVVEVDRVTGEVAKSKCKLCGAVNAPERRVRFGQ